jgi:hypothetical protein
MEGGAGPAGDQAMAVGARELELLRIGADGFGADEDAVVAHFTSLEAFCAAKI